MRRRERSSDARTNVFGERPQMSVFVPMRLLGGDDVDARYQVR
jgi:hypothetical protein